MLASCTTLDAKIQDTAPTICRTIEKGHTVFVASAVAGVPSARLVAQEAKAYAIAAPYCVNPSALTTAELLLLTAQQLIILKAAKDAENG
jgi:antitoxin (DNA-binding transcriptional repressor) of toxin-antitoxin stability system